MAFGILVVGMVMGLMAAIAVVPADAGILYVAASYITVGVLTFMSVIFFAMLSENRPEDSEFD